MCTREGVKQRVVNACGDVQHPDLEAKNVLFRIGSRKLKKTSFRKLRKTSTLQLTVLQFVFQGLGKVPFKQS